MRFKLFAIVAISILLTCVFACQAPTEPEADEPEAQSTCDRACLENYIDRYMDAMLSNEPSETLFAENCRFTENGVQLELGEGLWSSMVGKGTYTFYVPDIETQQIAFIGTAREESDVLDEGTPVAVAIRLKIEDSLVSEAEQLVIRPDNNLLDPESEPSPFSSAGANIEKMGEELGSPHPVYLEVIPPGERTSREEMIKTADYYFTGLQLNDGKGYYPFTDDCDRYENGTRATNVPLKPGETRPDPTELSSYSSAWTCKEQFESGLMQFVTRIRDRRYVAVDHERGIVFSFCFFDHAAGKTRHYTTPDGRDVIAGPTEPWTWQIAELFKIENGQIRRIEAILHRCPYGMNSGWSTYEQGMSTEIQDIK
jgi:hypothetical protein